MAEAVAYAFEAIICLIVAVLMARLLWELCCCCPREPAAEKERLVDAA